MFNREFKICKLLQEAQEVQEVKEVQVVQVVQVVKIKPIQQLQQQQTKLPVQLLHQQAISIHFMQNFLLINLLNLKINLNFI